MSIFSARNTQMKMGKQSVALLFWLPVLLALPMSLAGQFVVNGSASELSGNCYQLTPDQGGLAGSMFSVNSINLTQPFTITAVLHFGCKDANGADGIVFILATTNTALGGGGGFIGYEGITPSIAIEYDDYLNGWGDPAQDHMAVISNGSVDHNAPTNLVGPTVITEVEDCMDHCFTVDWNPVTQTLTALLDDDGITYTGDIINDIFGGNPVVYYGWSAGTGSLSNLHTVCVGPPELVPMDDLTICEGESVELDADENGAAWNWDPDPTLSELDIQNPIASPIQTTEYVVSIDYSCEGYAIDTVEVTVINAPVAQASNNGPLCEGELLELFASGGISYEWSGPLGFFSTDQNPQIQDVTSGHAGEYSVTVTDAAGCTSEIETTVVVFIAEDVEIEPVDVPVCEGAEAFQLTGVPGQGTWSGEVGPTGIFDPVSAGVGIHDVFYTITDDNGCTNTAVLMIEVVPNTPALIIPDGPFCVTDPVQQLSATPSGGVWGEAADQNGRIYPALLGVGTHEVTYFYMDQNGCYDAILYIEVLDIPEVSLMEIGSVCPNEGVQTLVADPPGGVWGGIADADGQFNPGVLGEGEYEAIYTFEASNGCADADTIEIIILPSPPQVANLLLQCDSLATGYVVSFEITGGDVSTYSVQGTPPGMLIPGSPYVFISDTIVTGGAYSFLVDDDNHCNPLTISGNYSCFCATGAGEMDLTLIQACAGDSIQVNGTINPMLDPNDSLIYVLHLGNSNVIDSIIQVSGDGIIFFNGGIMPGVTYYVSAVAGNASLPYGVDLNDPCLSVTIGTPVLWAALPEGYLNAPLSICTGDSARVEFLFSGTAPFDVVYSDGSALIPVNDIPNGYSVSVSPTTTTTYTLVFLADQAGNGCLNTLDTSVTITVNEPALNQRSIAICEGDSVFAGGNMQSVPGIYFDTLATAAGCDSIIQTELEVHPVIMTNISGTSCDLAQTGVFTQVFQDQNGCDSTVITTIAYALSDTTYITSGSCDQGQTGVFITELQTQEGCDSILIETVSLLPASATSLMTSTCDPDDTGTEIITLTNQYGCDSVVTITTVLIPADTTSLSSSTCDPAMAGVFMELYQNQLGCDSIVIENIQLSPSWQLMTFDETCNPQLAGQFIHTYATVDGCDSIVTETISLLPSDTVFSYSLVCEPMDTGTTVIVLQNEFGCDSLIYEVVQLEHEDSCKVLPHEIYVPNVFSPNGDQINDQVFIIGNPEVVQMVRLFRIYDRWGEVVFELFDITVNNPQQGWDGSFGDKELQPGVFVWTAEVEYVDGLTEYLIGDVTLVR